MSTSAVPAVRLSCEQCKRRKRKCDKEVPCTACKTAGIKCNTVQRARKSRGRTGTAQQQGGEIITRVARLEDLVRQLKAQVQSGQEDKTKLQSLPENPNALQKYVAADFWEALSQEANGIREILEEFDSEDSPSDPAFNSSISSMEQRSISETLLFNHGAPHMTCDPTHIITGEMKGILLPIYKTRVDCIIKVLHWPSVLAAIGMKNKGHQHRLETTRILALECAICYTAICSMTDEESEISFGCKKGPLREQLRLAVEITISRAKLLEQPDLTVLQAFLIYLIGLRCSTMYASAWTLLATALRLGNALGLGSEDPNKYSVFDLEIRRRIWSSIGVLDSQLALDRGASSLLSSLDLLKTPLRINDSDLYPDCSRPVVSRAFSDMTFASMTHHASICQKRIEERLLDTDDSWSMWKQTIAALNEFEEYTKLCFSEVIHCHQLWSNLLKQWRKDP